MPALAEYHLVPTSFYRPLLRAGHDYEGTMVMGLPEFKEIESALERAYPDRFPQELASDLDREFANTDLLSFLETAVARWAAHADEYEADGAPVNQSLDGLIALLDSAVEQLHCCLAVSHLTTATGEPPEIRGITCSRPSTGSNSGGPPGCPSSSRALT